MNFTKTFNETLAKLDDFFSVKSQNEKVIFMAFPLLVFGLLSYEAVTPMTQQMIDAAQADMQTVDDKITADNAYLESETQNGDREFFIKALQNEIVLLKKDQASVSSTRQYIDDKIKTNAGFIVYNQTNWAAFLNSISQRAAEAGFKVTAITNKIEDHNNTKLSKVLNIDVNGTGSFPKIMNFVDNIERNQLIVDIRRASLGDADSALKSFDQWDGIPAQLRIEIWGVDLDKR